MNQIYRNMIKGIVLKMDDREFLETEKELKTLVHNEKLRRGLV